MTRGGVSEETRTYCQKKKRDHAHVLGINNGVRVTGHFQHNSSCPTQEASQHHSAAGSCCCWSRSLSMTLFPFTFLGTNISQTNLRARTGNSHSLNKRVLWFQKGFKDERRGPVSTPLLPESLAFGTIPPFPNVFSFRREILPCTAMARPKPWLSMHPEVGQTDHLPCLLSQPCEADITKGIRWHFLDVPAGIPFLPQEDGRLGSIVQVLLPEIATLANNPPEKHTNNFTENS